MSLAPPCCAGRAANCMPTGPLPTDDLSHLCALPLTKPHGGAGWWQLVQPRAKGRTTRVGVTSGVGCGE